MSTDRCCEVAASDSRSAPGAAATADGERQRLTFALRSRDIVGWIVPSAILALLPKCPACLAAYVAVWSGLWLSLSTAHYLWWVLLILCAASLLYLVVRRLSHFIVVKQALLRWKVETQETSGARRKPIVGIEAQV